MQFNLQFKMNEKHIKYTFLKQLYRQTPPSNQHKQIITENYLKHNLQFN